MGWGLLVRGTGYWVVRSGFYYAYTGEGTCRRYTGRGKIGFSDCSILPLTCASLSLLARYQRTCSAILKGKFGIFDIAERTHPNALLRAQTRLGSYAHIVSSTLPNDWFTQVAAAMATEATKPG